MICKTNKRNENFHVEITTKKTFDLELDFKQSVIDVSTKTIYLGGKEEYSKEEVMELFACAYKQLEALKVTQASIDCTSIQDKDLGQAVLGLMLVQYKLKPTNKKPLDIELLTNSIIDIQEYIDLGTNMNIAKELSNAPANICTPEYVVNYTKELFKDLPVEIQVIKEEEIKELGMMGLYSIGMGSINRPELLIIRYMPCPLDSNVTALVGKGLTFDTGGYCLKPGAGMGDMKGDMGGASSTITILKTIVDQKLQKNVVALMPLCENRISDNAVLPGDIITMYDGSTVEILNTDAEGRVVLGDAVTYAIKNEKATSVIDMATLTGAAVAAFGHTITPILTNDVSLWNALEDASGITGEKFINMPYYKEHEKMIQSTMADIKNIGGKSCGVITAGLFIKHFVKDVPWMHFDIAGTHAVDSPMYDYQQAGTVSGAISSVYFMIKNK